MSTVRIVLAAVAAAVTVAAAGTAAADPTPSPGPYQIITPSGPQIGGLPNYPPICLTQPRACALTWDPNTGSWTAPGTGSP